MTYKPLQAFYKVRAPLLSAEIRALCGTHSLIYGRLNFDCLLKDFMSPLCLGFLVKLPKSPNHATLLQPDLDLYSFARKCKLLLLCAVYNHFVYVVNTRGEQG